MQYKLTCDKVEYGPYTGEHTGPEEIFEVYEDGTVFFSDGVVSSFMGPDFIEGLLNHPDQKRPRRNGACNFTSLGVAMRF